MSNMNCLTLGHNKMGENDWIYNAKTTRASLELYSRALHEPDIAAAYDNAKTKLLAEKDCNV